MQAMDNHYRGAEPILSTWKLSETNWVKCVSNYSTFVKQTHLNQIATISAGPHITGEFPSQRPHAAKTKQHIEGFICEGIYADWDSHYLGGPREST